jgi:protein CpxP
MDTNHTDPTETPDQTNGTNWSRRLVTGTLAVVVLAGVGAFAATAGDFGGGERMRFGMGPGHGMNADWRGGPGEGMHASWRGGPGFGIDRILDEIDATDEQQDKLEDIFDAARDEIRPLMRDFRDSHEELAELLAAPTVDGAALETMRADRVAAIDNATKKLTAALLQAAQVLTPEQRAELADHFEDRRGFGRW